ncbi:exported hypothetical protein [Azospirillaceae bacterium]
MKKTFLIITLLLIIPLSMAATWVQYTPSATTNNIQQVVSMNDGTAFAFTTTATNFLIYNGTWVEITKPTTSIVPTNFSTLSQALKLNNELLLFYIGSGNESNNYLFVKYDINTQAYTQSNRGGNRGTLTTTDEVYCIEDRACYMINETSSKLFEIYPTLNNLETTNETAAWSNLVLSNNPITLSQFSNSAPRGSKISEWNGISWINRGSDSTFTWKMEELHWFSTSIRVAFISEGGDYPAYEGVWLYNSTSGNYYVVSQNDNSSIKTSSTNNRGYSFYTNSNNIIYLNTNNLLFSYNYETNSTTYQGISQTFNDIDYSRTSDIGWAVGNSGVIYLFNDTAETIDDYYVSLKATSNPTIINKNISFCVTPNSPDGYDSDVNLSIEPAGLLLEFFDIPSGYKYCYAIDSLTWTNFQIGNYSVTATGNDHSSSTDTDTLTWRVIDVSVENTTYYNSSVVGVYNVTDQALSVRTRGDYETWFVSGYQNNLYLYQMIIGETIYNWTANSKTISKDTAGVNTLKSLALYQDNAFIATNNEMYVYNNITYTAEAAVKLSDVDVSGIFNDDIIDITLIDNNSVYAINHNSLTGNYYVQFYNISVFSWDSDYTLTNARSIEYDKNNKLLLVHNINKLMVFNETLFQSSKGTDGSIKNYSMLSQVSSGQDIISTSDNYLFYVYDYNKINRSSSTSFGANGQCRTANGYIRSIEAMSDDKVIIGVCSQNNADCKIEVCDFANNDLFYYSYYTSEGLDYLLSGYVPVEITKNSDDRYSIACVKGVLVYNFKSFTDYTEVNQPPTIDNVIFSNIDPCVTEKVSMTITASDNDGDILTYGVDCDSNDGVDYSMNQLSNVVYCTWSKVRNYNFNLWVGDGYHTNPTIETYSWDIFNCTPSSKIEIRLSDCVDNAPAGSVIIGASCTIDGVNATSTNSYGRLSFTTGDSTSFHTISCTADNHFSRTFEPTKASGDIKNYCLQSTSFGDNTALIVIAQNSSGTGISNTLVSVTNSETGENRYGLTDNNGQLVLADMFYGNKLIITAQNEQMGYEPTGQWYLSLAQGEQKTFYINLSSEWVTGQYVVTERNCSELIKGVWLCGFKNTSGTGDYCTNNTGCISGRCFMNQCSAFNYTICDNKRMGRGNACLFYSTINGSFEGIGNWILHQFFFVLILILLMAGVLLMRKKE